MTIGQFLRKIKPIKLGRHKENKQTSHFIFQSNRNGTTSWELQSWRILLIFNLEISGITLCQISGFIKEQQYV